METHKTQKRLKGVYLVPDPLMMKPHFGPSEHIKVGLNELSKYFDIELIVLGETPKNIAVDKRKSSNTKGVGTKNGFLGLLRDIKLLLKSNKGTEVLLNILHEKKIDFIYERGQYLDFRGVRVARKLGIKHFYEVNWLNYLGIQQFYYSWFNQTAKRMEEAAYRKSTLNFFVGTQHLLINIPLEKVFTIQNGIYEQLLNEFRSHENKINGKLKICYVANLMPHHRFDLFLEALTLANVNDIVELHLIGYNFEEYRPKLASIPCTFYGPVGKDQLPGIISKCNVGLISGGPSYSSFMKLFEYAAFKLCVICPDLQNIKLMFDETEIAYFKTNDSRSLAQTLSSISLNKQLVEKFGNNIYGKVKIRYTWEKIYAGIAEKIKRIGND